jgi:hypothetical protein
MRATLRLLCRRRRQAHKDTDEPQRVCAIGTARTERPNSASEKISRLRCWTQIFASSPRSGFNAVAQVRQATSNVATMDASPRSAKEPEQAQGRICSSTK